MNERCVVDGYFVMTEPVSIEGIRWSKIIEGGIRESANPPRRSIFLERMRDLMASSFADAYLVEIGTEHQRLQELYAGFGFKMMKEEGLVRKVMEEFLGQGTFDTFGGEDVIISRYTGIGKKVSNLFFRLSSGSRPSAERS